MIKLDEYKSTTQKNRGPVKTRENGWAIEALACHEEFTGEPTKIELLEKALLWICDRRGIPMGGYQGDEQDQTILYLSDTLSMARACLQLYRLTSKRAYLQMAEESACFIWANFSNSAGGFNRSTHSIGHDSNDRQIDENICLGRFMNLLHYYTDKPHLLDYAQHAMRYLCVPQIATSRLEEAGILLFDEEISTTPLKITITGDNNKPGAVRLQQSALRAFGWYKVIHWQNNH